MLESRGYTSVAITAYPNATIQEFKTDSFWHATFLDCDQMLFTNTKKSYFEGKIAIMVMHRHTHTLCVQNPLSTTWKMTCRGEQKQGSVTVFIFYRYRFRLFNARGFCSCLLAFISLSFSSKRCSGKQLAELNA